MIETIFSIVGTLSLFTGLALIAHKKAAGHVFMMFTASTYCGIMIANDLPLLAAKDAICGLIAVYSYFKWSIIG